MLYVKKEIIKNIFSIKAIAKVIIFGKKRNFSLPFLSLNY